jgi:hypothetical protein
MHVAGRAGRMRFGLGVGMAAVMLVGGYLLGRAEQAAHAQMGAPVSLVERAVTLDAIHTLMAAAVTAGAGAGAGAGHRRGGR